VVGVAALTGGQAARQPPVEPRRRRGPRDRPAPVVLERRLALAVHIQPGCREGPDRLQQSVRPGPRLVHDETAVDEGGDGELHVDIRQQRGEGAGDLEVEGPREHGEVPQGALLGLVEQVVAPADRRLHRVVAGVAASDRACGGARVRGAEVPAHVGQAPVARLSGSELHGQRQPVETGAELDDALVVDVPRHAGLGPTGPFDEQLGGGRTQRFDGDQLLGHQAERFAAGGEDVPRVAVGERDVEQFGRGLHDVLAVVQHHQQRPVGEVAAQLHGGAVASPSTPSARAKAASTSIDVRAVRRTCPSSVAWG
jgi:hypothetical protein